jgi:cytochrome b
MAGMHWQCSAFASCLLGCRPAQWVGPRMKFRTQLPFMMSPTPLSKTPIRVWDLPTRVFHGVLALAVLGLAITGLTGGDAMVWHFRLGYLVGSLLVFRWVWGVVGGHYSRFTAFLFGPRRILAYLLGQSEPLHKVGHNPMGALSVWTMLIFLTLQVASGLFSDDDIAFAGPLTQFVSTAAVTFATWYHKAVGKWVLLVLVLTHVGAIVFYLKVKGENLIVPMINGDKWVDGSAPASADGWGRRVLAAVIFAAACALFYVIDRQAA